MNSKQINICKNQYSIVENDSKFELDDEDKQKKIEYQRVTTFKIYKNCHAFAFNTNNTILFVGQNNGDIKVLGLYNQAKLIQTAFTSFQQLNCLIWRKKSNSLISGHHQNIIIWEFNKDHQLRPFQILKPIKPSCMILNEAEDLLVSGTGDFYIQFWKKESNSWICSQILVTLVYALCLNFNASQNKLILCGGGMQKSIHVIEQQNDKNWAITQTINVGGYYPGTSICFINDNKFAYQPYLENYLQIYDYNQKNNQFFKNQSVQIQKTVRCFWSFPSQFIKEQNILMIKHGKYINYFSKDKKGNVYLQHTLEFGSCEIYGKLSDDGRYQVTWDETEQRDESNKGSYQIQLRRLKYVND